LFLRLLSPSHRQDKFPETRNRLQSKTCCQTPGGGYVNQYRRAPPVTRWPVPFFHSGKQEGNKDLYYAKRISKRWVYQGPVGPNVNTGKEVEGNYVMDRAYNFYYIGGTEAMDRKACFSPDTGHLSHIVELPGIPKRKARFFKQELYGNIGVEISADGKVLYFSRDIRDLNGIFPLPR